MVVRGLWNLVSPMVHPRTRHKAVAFALLLGFPMSMRVEVNDYSMLGSILGHQILLNPPSPYSPW